MRKHTLCSESIVPPQVGHLPFLPCDSFAVRGVGFLLPSWARVRTGFYPVAYWERAVFVLSHHDEHTRDSHRYRRSRGSRPLGIRCILVLVFFSWCIVVLGGLISGLHVSASLRGGVQRLCGSEHCPRGQVWRVSTPEDMLNNAGQQLVLKVPLLDGNAAAVVVKMAIFYQPRTTLFANATIALRRGRSPACSTSRSGPPSLGRLCELRDDDGR